MKKHIIYKGYINLFISSLIVGGLAVLLADSLKRITTFFQEYIFENVASLPTIVLVLPSVGITIIYFTRKYLFKGKKNKGITEIFYTLKNKKDALPAYKISSHYINGFFTVIFGGSTGIEVSTVVSTAALGASIQRKNSVANLYKKELICAGVAAGISTLFGNPIAGFLFAVEVISDKVTKTIVLSCGVAALMSWLFLSFFETGKLFSFSINHWKLEAIPFMILLSVLAGSTAVFFTKMVLFLKQKFGAIQNNFLRVNIGALLLGVSIFFFPQLYGDSYHAIPELIKDIDTHSFSLGLVGLLLVLVVLKPVAASLTLGAGGDGGVFAPSIVVGGVLGMLVAVLCNYYLNTDLIVINFVLMGMAAMLSGAIHAPLTSLFLACGIVSGGYILFFPILMCSFIAKYAAKFLCNYTVYSYKG